MKPAPFTGRPILDQLTGEHGLWVYDPTDGVMKRASVSTVRAAPARTLSVSLTADEDDWSPTGLSAADTILVDASDYYVVTGIAAQPDGTEFTISATQDSNAFVLSSSDSRSSAANRFYFGVLPFIVILPGESARVVYSSSVGGFVLSAPPFFTESFKRQRLDHLVSDTAWTGLQTSVSGASAAVTRNFAGNDIGQASLVTGTDTTGRAGIGSAVAAMQSVYGGLVAFQGGAFMDPLSDGTNRFASYLGLLDSVAAEPSNGAYIKYSDNLNSGKWQAVAANNGVRTTGDTGYTNPGGSGYTYLAVLVYVAAKNADFYIGNEGSLAFAVRVNGVGNLNDGSNRGYGYGGSILKSLGTTSRVMAMLPFRFIYHAV